MKKEIELAKSWFVLAQICIILAGFIFTAGGIAWTISFNAINDGLQFTNEVIKITPTLNNSRVLDSYSNFSDRMIDYYREIGFSHVKLWQELFVIGGVLVILSLITWGFGYWKLNRVMSGFKEGEELVAESKKGEVRLRKR